MANPITVNLPADLPTDWVEGQTVAPSGADVGLSQQHGYNYLMQQVNNAQKAASELGQAFDSMDKKILIVPSQTGSVVYNGQAQSPAWANYDPLRLTLGGTTSSTNAGTYNATFAPKSGYTWADGTTATKTVTWTIKKAVIPVLPSQADKLIYNGSAQSPTWLNYDSKKLTLGGTTSRTDAGSSNATFTPTSNYTWWDSTTSAKTVAWSISRSPLPTPSLSQSAVIFNKDKNIAHVAVLRTGDGAISATSPDTSLATVSVLSNVVTITAVKTNGLWEAGVLITVSQGTNYEASSSAVVVHLSGEYVPVYGVKIPFNWGSNNPILRTDYAEGFSNPVPYVAGASSYGSPFDNILPWSGLKKVTDAYGNSLVEIPKFYYKLYEDSGYYHIKISMTQLSGYSVSPAHRSMRHYSGVMESDYAYIGRYHSILENSQWASKSGRTPIVGKTRAECRAKIQGFSGGLGYYYQNDYCMIFTVWLLYLVEFANFNSQEAIGRGGGNGSSAEATGYTDSMPYHTGTTQSSRSTYGLGTQYRYIEGLWDNVYDWIEGVYYDASKMYIQTIPSLFSGCDSGQGGVCASEWQTMVNSGNPNSFVISSPNGFPVFSPLVFDSGASSGTSDSWSYSSYSSSYGYCRGGAYNNSVGMGLFNMNYCSSSRGYEQYIGCRMMVYSKDGGAL